MPPGGGAQRVVARLLQSSPGNPGGAHAQPPGTFVLQLPEMRTQTSDCGSQTHSQLPRQGTGGGDDCGMWNSGMAVEGWLRFRGNR